VPGFGVGCADVHGGMRFGPEMRSRGHGFGSTVETVARGVKVTGSRGGTGPVGVLHRVVGVPHRVVGVLHRQIEQEV